MQHSDHIGRCHRDSFGRANAHIRIRIILECDGCGQWLVPTSPNRFKHLNYSICNALHNTLLFQRSGGEGKKVEPDVRLRELVRIWKRITV